MTPVDDPYGDVYGLEPLGEPDLAEGAPPPPDDEQGGWAPNVVGKDQAADLDRHVRASLPLVDWAELWRDDEDEAEEWIVEPLLPARRLVALYSAPKVGKSLLMLEIAVAVSLGTGVLGVRIDRPRRVLYVDFENDPRGDVRTRLEAMGYGPEHLGNLCYLSYPRLAALDTERGGRELLAAVQVYGCELVVVDTVSRAVRGEENENDTWLNFYRNTGLALKRAGVATVRLDHSGKDEAKGQRGGSAKSGDVDAVWRMTRTATDTFKLTCEAQRMLIHETELILTRETEPLRHKVEASGWMAANDALVQDIIRALDAAGKPRDTGRRVAREVIRDADIKASNGVLERALKIRQGSPERAPGTLDDGEPDACAPGTSGALTMEDE